MTSRTIAIANQKGGVGKTTVTLGLAAAVALTGRRVLVLDMDPQANASQTVLADYDELVTDPEFFTTNDILEAGVAVEDIYDAIRPTDWEGVDLIPSQQALANRDSEGGTGIEMRLRRMLRGLNEHGHPYDVVMIDCPPSVGHLTVNALLAAQEILLVSGPDGYGQNALNQIEATLTTIRESYDHDITVAGLVVNKWRKTREASLRTEQLRERFKDGLFEVIPERTAVPEAAGSHQSVFAMPGEGALAISERFVDVARTLGLLTDTDVSDTDSTDAEPAPVATADGAGPVAVGY